MFEIRRGGSNFSGTHVELAEVVVGVVVLRLELQRLFELGFSKRGLFPPRQVGGQVRSGRRGVRFQAHGLLKVRGGFGVLRLRGVHQSQKLVNLEAFRNLA